MQPTSQPVVAPLTRAAIFLTLTVNPGDSDPAVIRSFCGDLAPLLRAVGFRRAALQWLLFSEAALLLTLGLAAGVVSALVAVLPALRSPGAEVPAVSLTLTLAAVFISGLLWTWGATALALRGPLLPALRNE